MDPTTAERRTKRLPLGLRQQSRKSRLPTTRAEYRQTVLQRPEGARVLRINGKTDASTESDRLSQGFLGHVPLLLARERGSVMMVGLGSGMSLSSVLMNLLAP